MQIEAPDVVYTFLSISNSFMNNIAQLIHVRIQLGPSTFGSKHKSIGLDLREFSHVV